MPVYKNIYKSTPKVSPGSIDNVSNLARITDLNLRYDAGVRTMIFYGTVHTTHNPIGYNVQITFKNVKRDDGLTEEEIIQGFQPKPTLSKHEMQVRCSCASYRFRFDQANRSNGVGTGAKFPIYHRLTNRKPNNPKNLMGFCKHVIEFVDYLQKQGFIH